MKSFLISAAAIAVAATTLVTPAITQTSNSAPANPPTAGSSGPGGEAGPGPGYGPRGYGWGRGMMMGPGMMGASSG